MKKSRGASSLLYSLSLGTNLRFIVRGWRQSRHPILLLVLQFCRSYCFWHEIVLNL